MQVTFELRCEETIRSWPCDVLGRGNSKVKGLVSGGIPQRQSQRQGLGCMQFPERGPLSKAWGVREPGQEGERATHGGGRR